MLFFEFLCRCFYTYLEKNNILAPLISNNFSRKVKYFSLIICLAVHNITTAQSADVPPPPPPTTFPELPVDGGLVFLFVAGLVLGVYFILRTKRKTTN